MHPHGTAAQIGAGRSVGDAAHVAAGVLTNGETAFALGAAAPGDIMLACLPAAGTPQTILGGLAGDWTYVALSGLGSWRVWRKVLQQADLDDALSRSSSSGLAAFVVKRGPLATSQRWMASGGGSGSVVFSSAGTVGGPFTKNGWCAGLVSFAAWNGGGSQPAGWTARASASFGGQTLGVADVAPAGYANGASLTYGVGSPGSVAFSIDELLNY